jgi:hypothetical protein
VDEPGGLGPAPHEDDQPPRRPGRRRRRRAASSASSAAGPAQSSSSSADPGSAPETGAADGAGGSSAAADASDEHASGVAPDAARAAGSSTDAAAASPAVEETDASVVDLDPVEAAAAPVGPAVTVRGLDLAFGRSPRPDTCPFLRSVGSEGALTFPEEAPAPANRCIALGDPAPQSTRQQELMCLRAEHVDCPRFVRGTTAVQQVEAKRAPRIARSTLAAALILVASAVFTFGFVVVRGGLDIPSGTPQADPGTAAGPPATAAPTPAATPTVAPTSTPVVTPTPPPTPTPVPSPSATPVPSPTSTVAPSPSTTPASTPSATRLALLVPCPDQPDCYIYTVKRGDTFLRLIGFFGVPYAETLEMNPWLRNPSLIVVGDRLRIPTPTR